MSFLLLQIMVCLLIAALIGGVIGWYLRGGCDKQLQEQNEECEMKLRAVEREWNTKLNYPEEQKLANISADEISTMPPAAEADLKNNTLFNTVATALGVAESKSTTADINIPKKVQLSDEKVQLFKAFDIDIENTPDLEDEYDIEKIEGITEEDTERFHALEIFTTSDLLKKLDKNNPDLDDLANKLKAQPEELLSWVSMADLLRLPKLNPKNAYLIKSTGITSVRDLSGVNTFSLHKEMISVNEKLHIVDSIPDIDTLETWSKVSKILG